MAAGQQITPVSHSPAQLAIGQEKTIINSKPWRGRTSLRFEPHSLACVTVTAATLLSRAIPPARNWRYDVNKILETLTEHELNPQS